MEKEKEAQAKIQEAAMVEQSKKDEPAYLVTRDAEDGDLRKRDCIGTQVT